MSLPAQFYQLKENLFNDLKVQIEKDFYLCGIPTISNNLNPEEYYSKLKSTITQLHLDDYQTLKNMLYRVDIKEVDIESISIKFQLNIEESITVAILNRSLQKIELKKKV